MNHSKITWAVFLVLLISICFNISSLATDLDSKQKRSKVPFKRHLPWLNILAFLRNGSFPYICLSWEHPLLTSLWIPMPSTSIITSKPYYKTESFRPYELAGRLMHLHSSTASDLRPSLLIVNFEIEMWIIFLPGSSSLITLNLALTIYKDGRFLLIPNDWQRLTFFYIKTHNSCISKRCD